MSGALNYDEDVDAIYVQLSNTKAKHTVEFSENINIDFSNSDKVVGVEILSASSELSKIFGHVISKTEIKNILCTVTDYYLQFKNKKTNETANLLLPVYKSPLLSV